MLRVTNGMLAGSVVQGLAGNRERLARLQGQIAGGKALTRPSDGAAAYVENMKVQSALQRLDRYDQNMGDARAWLSSTEGALRTLGDILQRARELAMQGANDTIRAEDRRLYAAEVGQLLRAAVDTANSTHNGAFLFGGFRSDALPFTLDPATLAVTYNGDSGQAVREIGPGVQVQANLPGTELQGAADLFAALRDLYDQLNSPAPTAAATISATVVPAVDAAFSNLARLLADLGARGKQVELAESRARDLRVGLEARVEQGEGTDLARALIDLNTEETVYRAALGVGARLLPPSLLDFLR